MAILTYFGVKFVDLKLVVCISLMELISDNAELGSLLLLKRLFRWRFCVQMNW